MKTSESIKNIIPALFKAQKLMGGAKKNADNPYFKSKYADLGAVLSASEGLLNDNDIMILQPTVANEHGEFVETVLTHVPSGEWISAQTKLLSVKLDPQAQGSAITYARRYGLQSLLGMPSEDDDANAASGKEKTSTKSTKQSPVTGILTNTFEPGKAGDINQPKTTGFGSFKAAKAAAAASSTSNGTVTTPVVVNTSEPKKANGIF